MKKINEVTDTEKEILSYNSYHLDNPEKLEGWEMVYHETETRSGFEGQVYKKGNTVVIVYKGTDAGSFKDYVNDAQMLFNNIPKQQEDAYNLFLKTQLMFKDSDVNIELTGHSLGGSLAQVVSAKSGVSATTFNAFGTGKILKKMGYKDKQLYNMSVKNYGNPKDPIFNFNSLEQPGKTFITNTNLDPKRIYPITHGLSSSNLKYHSMENMNNLDDAVEITPLKDGKKYNIYT